MTVRDRWYRLVVRAAAVVVNVGVVVLVVGLVRSSGVLVVAGSLMGPGVFVARCIHEQLRVRAVVAGRRVGALRSGVGGL